MKKIHLIAVMILAVGIMAAGCSGIPLPKNPDSYATWIEEQGDIDIVHIKFDMNFETKGASESEIMGFLSDCSDVGTCGLMARLKVDGVFQGATLSSSCTLIDQGAEEFDTDGNGTLESTEKIKATCQVPVNGDVVLGGSQKYGIVMTGVAPHNLSGDELVFTSSPEFPILNEVPTI